MKKFINVLGLVLIAVLAGFSAFWYVLANQAEQVFVAKLAQWQEEKKIEKLTYDNIYKEGFPWNINIRLENPHLVVNPLESKAKIDSVLNGSMTLTGSLWNKEYGFDINGLLTTLFPAIAEAPAKQPKLVWKGRSTFTVSGENVSHFEILKDLLLNLPFENAEDQAKHFEFVSFNTHTDEFNFTGELNEKEKIDFKGGAFDLDVWKKNYKKNQEEFNYKFSAKDFVAHFPQSGPFVRAAFFTPEELGKMTIAIDGSVCYPESKVWEEIIRNPLGHRQAEVCLKVDRFDFTSDLMTSTLKNLALILQQDNDKFTFTAKTAGEGSYTEKYTDAVRRNLTVLLKDPEFLNERVTTDAALQKRIMEHSKEIVNLVPPFDTFGKITDKLDFVASVTVLDNAVKDAKLNLAALEYHVSPYDLSITGKGEAKENLSDPVFNGALKINRYKQLIDQLSAYGNRVIEVYNIVGVQNEADKLPIATPNEINSILTFLKAISEDPKKDSADLKVNVSYNEKDHWKIGTLNLDEFNAKFAELQQSLAPAKAAGEAPAEPTAPQPVVPAPVITPGLSK